jgi:hypothetical protein
MSGKTLYLRALVTDHSSLITENVARATIFFALFPPLPQAVKPGHSNSALFKVEF